MKIGFIVFVLLFSQELYSQQKDNSEFVIKAKLLKAQPLTPSCGVIAWASAQKFEVIEVISEKIHTNKVVLLIMPCPEFLGADFFKDGRLYSATVSTTSGASFDYLVVPSYEKEKLSTFWIRDIKLAE